MYYAIGYRLESLRYLNNLIEAVWPGLRVTWLRVEERVTSDYCLRIQHSVITYFTVEFSPHAFLMVRLSFKISIGGRTCIFYSESDDYYF